jgi:hypothetical protein
MLRYYKKAKLPGLQTLAAAAAVELPFLWSRAPTLITYVYFYCTIVLPRFNHVSQVGSRQESKKERKKEKKTQALSKYK